jgi:ribonuclease HI
LEQDPNALVRPKDPREYARTADFSSAGAHRLGVWIVTTPHVEIFTDGACSGNPGPGGWAAILRAGHHEKEISGAEAATTNNRMELMAAIKAFEALKGPSNVKIHTDSRYVMDGLMKWMKRWKVKRLAYLRQKAGQE